jgi:hypothetical protein
MPKHSDTAARRAQEPSQAGTRGNGASSDPTCPQAWMSGLEFVDPGSRFDPSVPHPAGCMATGWAARIITRLIAKSRRR